jgi:hypothetical protein
MNQLQKAIYWLDRLPAEKRAEIEKLLNNAEKETT